MKGNRMMIRYRPALFCIFFIFSFSLPVYGPEMGGQCDSCGKWFRNSDNHPYGLCRQSSGSESLHSGQHTNIEQRRREEDRYWAEHQMLLEQQERERREEIAKEAARRAEEARRRREFEQRKAQLQSILNLTPDHGLFLQGAGGDPVNIEPKGLHQFGDLKLLQTGGVKLKTITNSEEAILATNQT